MRFEQTTIPGVTVIELDLVQDERGFFARTWCRREFGEKGLNPELAQCSLSFNRHKGTLRGMHYQAPPHEEAKLVQCVRGGVYDVALDLRPGSAAFGQWTAVELTAGNRRMLYVPEGVAHGFQTLEDDTEVFYQISGFFHPESAKGARWDDPAFGIAWPLKVTAISERDANWPRV